MKKQFLILFTVIILLGCNIQPHPPIAKVLKGRLNTVIQLSGTLDQEFSPELSSVTGNALAELLTATIMPENTALLQRIIFTWEESTVTWNNQPTVDIANQVIAYFFLVAIIKINN